jgi:glyoxylate utilization-related uncharacterized protein
MPRISKQTVREQDHGPVVEWREDHDGHAVQFVHFRADMDATPMLKGLPDDRCQSPHWGYVLKGKLRFLVGDHEETFEAGDAFYLPPGHIPVGNDPDSEYLQFSPCKELDEVSEAIARNMQAMQAG